MTWSLLFTRSFPGPLIVSDGPLKESECILDAETYRSLNIPVFRADGMKSRRKTEEWAQNEESLAGGS